MRLDKESVGMNDLTIAERLLYSTVKITAYQGENAIGTGTGFFMRFAERDERFIPAIVTNKHVVQGADRIMAVCHFDDGDRPSGKFVACTIVIAPGSYIEHPDHFVDLCAIPMGDIMNKALNAGTPIFMQWLDKGIIPEESEWQDFDAIEEVTMIGCPNGISDEVNNLPMARRGITASPLSKKYNGKEEFVVDMACFPGSSGSPVFIYDRNGYLDRKTNVYRMGAQRIMLVGILYAGPQIANNGQIILAQPPRVMVAAMMHLGNVIRSSELHVIDAEFCKRILVPATPETNVEVMPDETKF
jgi:Trypsin-like peptidase domain